MKDLIEIRWHGRGGQGAKTAALLLADVAFNTSEIENAMARAEGQGVEILCCPELSLTGYTCQDLFGQQLLLEQAETAMLKLIEFSRNLNLTTIVGIPFRFGGALLNCAAVIQ